MDIINLERENLLFVIHVHQDSSPITLPQIVLFVLLEDIHPKVIVVIVPLAPLERILLVGKRYIPYANPELFLQNLIKLLVFLVYLDSFLIKMVVPVVNYVLKDPTVPICNKAVVPDVQTVL